MAGDTGKSCTLEGGAPLCNAVASVPLHRHLCTYQSVFNCVAILVQGIQHRDLLCWVTSAQKVAYKLRQSLRLRLHRCTLFHKWC